MFFYQYLILSLFKLFAIYSSVLQQSNVVEYAIAPAHTHPNQVEKKCTPIPKWTNTCMSAHVCICVDIIEAPGPNHFQ